MVVEKRLQISYTDPIDRESLYLVSLNLGVLVTCL